MPAMIAGRFWCAGRPATAMPTTTALSPASVTSIRITCASKARSWVSAIWSMRVRPLSATDAAV
ncbi:MAG: hypothetical protein WDN25_00685 [Acetobacteraceae bacterium]